MVSRLPLAIVEIIYKMASNPKYIMVDKATSVDEPTRQHVFTRALLESIGNVMAINKSIQFKDIHVTKILLDVHAAYLLHDVLCWAQTCVYVGNIDAFWLLAQRWAFTRTLFAVYVTFRHDNVLFANVMRKFERDVDISAVVEHSVLSGNNQRCKWLYYRYRRSFNLNTCLRAAVHTGNIKLIRWCISQGAVFNKHECLCEAIICRNLQLSSFFVKRGACLNTAMQLAMAIDADEICMHLFTITPDRFLYSSCIIQDALFRKNMKLFGVFMSQAHRFVWNVFDIEKAILIAIHRDLCPVIIQDLLYFYSKYADMFLLSYIDHLHIHPTPPSISRQREMTRIFLQKGLNSVRVCCNYARIKDASIVCDMINKHLAVSL